MAYLRARSGIKEERTFERDAAKSRFEPIRTDAAQYMNGHSRCFECCQTFLRDLLLTSKCQ